MANFAGYLTDKDGNRLSVLDEKVVFEKSYEYGKVWLDAQTINIDGAGYRWFVVEYVSNWDGGTYTTGLCRLGANTTMIRLAYTDVGWAIGIRHIMVSDSQIVLENAHYANYNGDGTQYNNAQCCPRRITLYR